MRSSSTSSKLVRPRTRAGGFDQGGPARSPRTSEHEVTTHGLGELTGEIGQLWGRIPVARRGPAPAPTVPRKQCLSIPRSCEVLVVGPAEVGEAVMRALILRRVFLIETGAGLVLLGSADTPDALHLQNFLKYNGVPYTMLNPQRGS